MTYATPFSNYINSCNLTSQISVLVIQLLFRIQLLICDSSEAELIFLLYQPFHPVKAVIGSSDAELNQFDVFLCFQYLEYT